MDTTRPFDFTVEDASGVSHSYSATYHIASEGFAISVELVQVLGEPLLRALGDIQEVAQDAVTAVAAGAPEEVEALLDGVDLAGAMAALRSLDPVTVVNLGQRILKYTSRDGKRLQGHDFDVAYRGNYTELYMALWKVIEANRFVPFLGTLS